MVKVQDKERDLSAAECIAAGMYWYSQRDLSAAEAWWLRALQLEPGNHRAEAYLRLLETTNQATKSVQDEQVREEPTDIADSESIRLGLLDLTELSDLELDDEDVFTSVESEKTIAVRHSIHAEVGERLGQSSPYLELPDDLLDDLDESSSVFFKTTKYEVVSDAVSEVSEDNTLLPDDFLELPTLDESASFRFRDLRDIDPAEEETGKMPPLIVDRPDCASPWDEGPSMTSPLVVKGSSEFDAVADPTPLPEVDLERFFKRGDLEAADEIVDYLRSTGDFLEPVPKSRPARVRSSSDIEDALATQPHNTISFGDPQKEENIQAAKERFQLHDFQGVIDALGDIASDDAENTEIRNLLAESRSQLLRMYESKIGSLTSVPRVLISSEEIIWLNLNHRAGFILSQVDGTVSYDDLISLSGMPRLDTVKILATLIEQRVIGI